MTARRGTSNGNSAGSAEDRRRRRAWLLDTYQADVDTLPYQLPGFQGEVVWEPTPLGTGAKACRCYRCGTLLTLETLTVDRIIPGCQGGTYRRSNIRPACAKCNERTGGGTRRHGKHKCLGCRREDPDNQRSPRKVVQRFGFEGCATHVKQWRHLK